MASKDFLALNPQFNAADLPGANRRRAKCSAPGLARPERAKPGDGDRVRDLMTLAGHGWTCYHCQHGEHYMTGRAGVSEKYQSYREMLDGVLEISVH